MYCKNCGQPIPDQSQFCPSCGAQTGQDPTPPTVQPVYQYPPAQPAVKPKKKKRWLIAVIIIAIVLVALILGIIFGGGSCSVTTANLTDAAMASKIDANTMEPITKTKVFAVDTPVIYATALLKNAPEDTKITAKWYYVTDDFDIASVDVMSTETSQYVSFTLTQPDAGFPVGDYKVELYIDDKLSETLEFEVK